MGKPIRAEYGLVVAAVFGAMCFYQVVYNVLGTAEDLTLFTRLWSVFKTVCLASLTAAAVDFSFCGPIAETHSRLTAIIHYLLIVIFQMVGILSFKKVEKQTKSVKETQEKFLLDLLKQRKATEYGKDFCFWTIHSREQFVQKNKLTVYSDYKSYIDRIKKGEENVLFPDRPLMMALTSSTSSGVSKAMPISADYFMGLIKAVVPLMTYLLMKAFPKSRSIKKTMSIMFKPRYLYTESGIVMGPIISPPRTKLTDFFMMFVSTPVPALDIPTEAEMMYIHLLFGLKDKNLSRIETSFAPVVVSMGKTMESKWEQLVHDIRVGRIDPALNIDEGLRWKLNLEYLEPDPERAEFLQREFEKGFDGIFKRVWPHLSYIYCLTSGSFSIHMEKLRNGYARGCDFYSLIYGATEGMFAFNLWPHQEPSRYMMVPILTFYEFIPLNQASDDQPETLFLEQVNVGEMYELVVTTLNGLYRFRVGDVIKVVAKLNQTPVIEFMYRQGQLLNVHGEKTSENAVYDALMKSASQWNNAKIKDYSCCESILASSESSSAAGYYIAFLEFDEGQTIQLTNEQKLLFDENLRQESYPYESFRRKNAILPMQVNIVKEGTFAEFRDYILTHSNASANQVKLPRALRRQDYYSFMKERVIG